MNFGDSDTYASAPVQTESGSRIISLRQMELHKNRMNLRGEVTLLSLIPTN